MEKPPPHAVFVPFPAQGHINPMLKLAKLLNLYRGFHITFVNTEYNYNRLLKSSGPDSLNGTPTFCFETIPDGLPLLDANAVQDFPSLFTCVVSDCVMSFTLKAAQELNIPNVLFWTASACGFTGYVHYRNLIERGLAPLKDVSYLTNGYMNTVIDWIPGMEGISLKDLPSLIRTTDPDDILMNYNIGEVENARNASALIFNTVYDLEREVLEVLSPTYPPIYTISPLQLLLNEVSPENSLSGIKSNLLKEQPGCLEWLDTKESNSVVYVNFGSITLMSAQQLIEFAWGLANSKKNFLWVIRPDLVMGESVILPPEFVSETIERSLLTSWCPQEQVLNHPAIGGFLTHSGWNSTIESLCGGVPMLCWPFFAEQQTNCWFCQNKWGIGMEIHSNSNRDEIERSVRELMEGEKGKQMKNKAMQWKSLVEKATTAPNGSSHLNIEKMIKEVLLTSKNHIG
ncbi:hypothetical protein EZV62_021947 [Acer yangbiense]|uniref:Glycosyltransferase n=1 Tax=Acer yangbiense TaxID=1000413 RepID=A0A5C7H6W0_9ROSI|nr:hypothetical protein EZV62_021947 [Acer yangbiense]